MASVQLSKANGKKFLREIASGRLVQVASITSSWNTCAQVGDVLFVAGDKAYNLNREQKHDLSGEYFTVEELRKGDTLTITP